MNFYMTAAQVRSLCGNVSDMTLWRWLTESDFPKPVRVNGRRYWHQEAVSDWWLARETEKVATISAAFQAERATA